MARVFAAEVGVLWLVRVSRYTAGKRTRTICKDEVYKRAGAVSRYKLA